MDRFLSALDHENPRFAQQYEEIKRQSGKEIQKGIKIAQSGDSVWDTLIQIFSRILGLTVQIEDKGQLYYLGRRSAEYFVRRASFHYPTGLSAEDLGNPFLSYSQITTALKNILEDRTVREKLQQARQEGAPYIAPTRLYTGIFSKVSIIARQVERPAALPTRSVSQRSRSGQPYLLPQGLPEIEAPKPTAIPPVPDPVAANTASQAVSIPAPVAANTAPVVASNPAPVVANTAPAVASNPAPVAPIQNQSSASSTTSTVVDKVLALHVEPAPLYPARPDKLFRSIKKNIDITKYITTIASEFGNGGINSIPLVDSKECPLPVLGRAIYMQQNPARFGGPLKEDFANAMAIIMKNLGKLPFVEQFWLYDIIASETCIPQNLQSEVSEDNVKQNQAVFAILRDIIVANYNAAKERADVATLVGYMKKERAQSKDETAVKFYDDFAQILKISLV